MKPVLSIVSPVYMGADIVDRLVERIAEEVEKIGVSYEIILVNDGSPDQSWQAILNACKKSKFVKGADLSRNFGQHYAIAAGISLVSGEWIVVMDCDLQDDPSEIPRLYAKAQGGYDAVLARRTSRKDSFFKRSFSKLFYKALSFLTDSPQDPEIANFGIYSKRVMDEYNRFEERFRYFPVLVRWLGFRQTSIPVAHAAREVGKSSYNFRSLLRLASEVILAFSDKPLRLMIGFGAVITTLAMIAGVAVILRALETGFAIQGWASLIVSVWFMGGLIISSLGVIGLYIGRIFKEVKRRPNYIISHLVSYDQNHP